MTEIVFETERVKVYDNIEIMNMNWVTESTYLGNPKVYWCNINIIQRKYTVSFPKFGLTCCIYDFIVSLNCIVSRDWISYCNLCPAAYTLGTGTSLIHKFRLNTIRSLADICLCTLCTLCILAPSCYSNTAQIWVPVQKAESGCVEMDRVWWHRDISWKTIPVNTYPVSGTNTYGRNNILRDIAKEIELECWMPQDQYINQTNRQNPNLIPPGTLSEMH